MKLIVDSNILFAAFLKDGMTRHILQRRDEEFYSINVSVQDFMKYKDYLSSKAGINEEEFTLLLEQMFGYVIMLDNRIVQKEMPEAKKHMDAIDRDDTIFLAAALATGSDIWSDDPHFQQQKKVKVWTTKDLVEKWKK